MDIFILLIIGAVISGIIGALLGSTVHKGGAGWWLGLLLGPIGWIIVFLLPRGDNKTALLNPSPPDTQPKRNENFAGPANLADADYKIWLTEEYSITKNDVLGQFYCCSRLFNTVDEAVAYAHELETQKRNAEREKQQAEKERQDEIKRERQTQTEETERLRIERQKKNRPYFIAAWLIVFTATGLGIFTLGAMERERVAAERERVAAIPQKIEDQGYAIFSDDIRKRDGVYLVRGTDVPFTGIGRASHENGQISEEINLVNGVERERVSRHRRPNGQLWWETSYVNNIRNGLERVWHKNGKLQEETNYVDGKEHGLKRTWHDNGQLDSEINYVDGEKHGLERTWKDNGEEYSLSLQCYRNGVKVSGWRGGACP